MNQALPAPDLEALFQLPDPLACEATLQAHLKEARGNGADPSALVELLAFLARAQSLQARPAEAHDTLKEAEALLDQGKVSDIATMRWLLEKGRVYILERTPSQARNLFGKAWTLALKTAEDRFTVEIAHLMAAIEPLKDQEVWILKALKIAEASTDERARHWLGKLHVSLAWKQYSFRQYEGALDNLKLAFSYLETQGSPKEKYFCRWSTGKVLRTMGRLEEALSAQLALVRTLQIQNIHDGRVYEELAECLHELHRPEEAQGYFELAYRELSSDGWVNDNYPLKLKRLKDMGHPKS